MKQGLFFCHGVPGSPADAELLDCGPAFDLHAPNLFDQRVSLLDQFDRWQRRAPKQNSCVIGFSIGAMSALHLAAARPGAVRKLILISAAAPLQAGRFLDDMAGASIFKLAQSSSFGLRAVTFGQSLLSRLGPDLLIRELFKGVGPLEADLVKQPQFRALLRSAFRNSFQKHPSAYQDVLRSYVTDWREVLLSVSCPVDMWHGKQDGWAPFSMAQALQHALGPKAVLHTLDHAGHYSALLKARVHT